VPPDPLGTQGIDPAALAGFMALRELLVAAHRLRQAWANRLGITNADTFAVGFLASDQPRTARELAEFLDVAQSSVTAVIDRLERAGVAERRSHPTDRRALIIALTDRGRRELAAMRRTNLDALGVEGARLAPDLRRIARGLESQFATFARPATLRPASA